MDLDHEFSLLMAEHAFGLTSYQILERLYSPPSTHNGDNTVSKLISFTVELLEGTILTIEMTNNKFKVIKSTDLSLDMPKSYDDFSALLIDNSHLYQQKMNSMISDRLFQHLNTL
ncbi:hypothetical protein AX774_g8118 [Zancudomyces culisetae]|uniref:GSKIP domain-containing protein n=1 Tax=Zancudomyces culisetae TaxID=1213189 RepID=A0A1R1PC24_ZANCU|nr:hypothetical protein AX774_g8118 [Zancudomyces culisetae]|eukprot:OMH78491.1 hypothetical protein AX774_g8118 [Zancudomyces culisetae]